MKTSTLRVGASLVAVSGAVLLSGCAATIGGSGDAASSAPASADTSASDAAVSYKDGSYTADGSYLDGAQNSETITVQVTVAGGNVTKVNVTGKPSNAESKEYQDKFVGGISDAVVGKSIADLLGADKVDKVAGSSLTSGGFNDALAKIAAEAKA